MWWSCHDIVIIPTRLAALARMVRTDSFDSVKQAAEWIHTLDPHALRIASTVEEIDKLTAQLREVQKDTHTHNCTPTHTRPLTRLHTHTPTHLHTCTLAQLHAYTPTHRHTYAH